MPVPDSNPFYYISSSSMDRKWTCRDIARKTLIGEGGFSKVFSASVKGQKNLRVALKFTSEETLTYLNRNTKGATCAFHEEYEMHRALKHENVVKVLGFYKVRKNSVMVMEFCARGDLQEYISGGTVLYTKERSRKYARDVANGIVYLHTQMNTIHMDLKLENVLVTDTDVAKITDFGFAIKTQYLRKLHYKSRGGTRWYKPPEQLTVGHFDSTADIWAFGCVAYELMIQHHPFFNTDANENEKGNKYNSKDEEPAAISRMAQLDNYLQKHLFVEECPEFQIFISQVLQFSRFRRPVASDLMSLPWISTPSPLKLSS